MTEFFAGDVRETEAVGERLGSVLKDGDVVFLYGGLGAGKTAFTRGIARGMGISASVKSPTFTIAREYGRLFHFDLYRITGEEEFLDLGFESYRERGVCVVEWPQAAESFVKSTVSVHIEYEGEGRRIRLSKDI